MLNNKNKELLKLIRGRLQELGFHPTRVRKEKKNYHYIVTYRKQEVIEVLKRLPLKHPEKIAIKHLILSKKLTKEQKYRLYKKYREHVKREVKKNVKRAEREYWEKRNI